MRFIRAIHFISLVHMSVSCAADMSMSWITMHRAQESDLNCVFECDVQMTNEVYLSWLMSVVPFSHTYVPQLIDQVGQSNQKFYHTCVANQSQRVFLWVFEDRDSAEIIGFGLCRLIFDDSLLIDTLYVKPKYRRRGIVRWFIARVRHVFPLARRLILETLKGEASVRGERSAAITAYEAFGFCQMTSELLAQLRHWFPAREHFVLPDGFLWDCLRDMYYERLVYEFPDRECKKEGVGKKIGSILWSILSVIKTPINSTRERARE